jgi:hypothetical protein
MSVATNVLQSLHAPLLLATTDIDINGTLSSSHDPNDILLYDFDRQVFLEVMLVYAAPMAAALVVRHSAHAACPMRVVSGQHIDIAFDMCSMSLVLPSRPVLSLCTKVASD